MPNDIINEDIMKLLELTQENQGQGKSLEQLLYDEIFNQKLYHQRILLKDNGDENTLYEIREGSIINGTGETEDIQELIINTNSFADGSPMNVFGIVRCEKCNQLIREESQSRCKCCLKVICISRGCAKYSIITDSFYCSWLHKYFDILRKLIK